MRNEDNIRLRHMLDAARQAQSFAKGETRGSLEKDRKLVFALLKAVEVIGEAASQVSKDTRKTLPMIPWADIIGMRHRLMHAYFDINLDVLWNTIAKDLPPLVGVLEEILEGQ
jgi:uncharacterized protein with HEPN domain